MWEAEFCHPEENRDKIPVGTFSTAEEVRRSVVDRTPVALPQWSMVNRSFALQLGLATDYLLSNIAHVVAGGMWHLGAAE